MISKAIRAAQRYKEHKRRDEIIKEVLENTKNLKKIKKNLSFGNPLTTYILNHEGEKLYDWEGINHIGTKFYANLYSLHHDQNFQNENCVNDLQDQDKHFPTFLPSEIETRVKRLKPKNALLSDGITNELIKQRGGE